MKYAGVVFAVWLTLFAASAQAECEPYSGSGPKPSLYLTISFSKQCLGGNKDTAEISQQVVAALPDIDVAERQPETAADYAAIREGTLALIGAIEASMQSQQMDSSFLGFRTTAIKMMNIDATNVSEGREHRAQLWQPTGTLLLDGMIDLGPAIETHCAVRTSQECASAWLQAAQILRHSWLMARVLGKSDVDLDALTKAYSALDDSWDYYFEDTRSQYIWELALNDRRFKNRLKETCRSNSPAAQSLSGNELDSYCNAQLDIKLSSPPVDQWIVMHPNAAFEYVENDDSDNSAMRAVATIELIGYNRFANINKDGSWEKKSWPLGVSLISTVSLDSNGDRFGYGAMFHVRNRFSFGVAQREFSGRNETTWLLSMDLGQLFLDASEKARKRFRTLGL